MPIIGGEILAAIQSWERAMQECPKPIAAGLLRASRSVRRSPRPASSSPPSERRAILNDLQLVDRLLLRHLCWGRKKRCIIVLTNPALIVVFSVGGFVLIFALCAAMFIKLYSPGSLSFVQALLISGWSIFVSTVLVIVFTALKTDLKPAPVIDGLSALILLCLSGVLITRQARKYGVEKSGWLGVGGKAILSAFALSSLFFAAYLVVHN
jgi:hypothetical protein